MPTSSVADPDFELRKIKASDSADIVGKIQPITISPYIMFHLQLTNFRGK
jgi:hypothetical protein